MSGKKKEIAVVDIETTGFKEKHDCIVEVGIVSLNLETGKIKDVYDELVREAKFSVEHYESWIFKNSNLEFEDVLNADPLDTRKLQRILTDFYATAWNSSFDFGFLKSRGLKLSELPCPMKQSKDYFELPGSHGYKYASVQEAWNILFPGNDYVEKHRGFDDAAHEAKIIHELRKRGVW